MPAAWAAGAAAVGTLGGAYLSSQAAKGAANTSAEAQRYAADRAAEAAAFRPVGVTTNLGKSNFTYGAGGELESAGYTLDPRLQNIQNNVFGYAGAYNPEQIGQAAQPLMGGAQRAFNLGQQYVATSPEQAAQDWMAQQRELMAPGYERQLAGIRNANYQTGRGGLATGGTTAGGMMQSNPELAAFYNAQAQQERTLAAQADAYGQQRTTYGLNLYGTGGGLLGQVPSLTTAGYSPLQTQLGVIGSVEGMGQQPFDISTALGARQATAGANVGNALLTGGISAAKTQQAGNAYSPAGAALMGIGSNASLNNWFQDSINPYARNNGNPYANASTANRLFGSENVYGYGGGGQAPTQSQWDASWGVD
jgi:hypothetical protein